jgi:hypothetical protein
MPCQGVKNGKILTILAMEWLKMCDDGKGQNFPYQ